MDPTQAIEILDQVAANALLTRNHHVAAQQAVDVLRAMMVPKSSAEPPTKED